MGQAYRVKGAKGGEGGHPVRRPGGRHLRQPPHHQDHEEWHRVLHRVGLDTVEAVNQLCAVVGHEFVEAGTVCV